MIVSYACVGRDRYFWAVGSYESWCGEKEPEHSGYVEEEHEAWGKCEELRRQLDQNNEILWIAPRNYKPNIMRLNIPAAPAREWHKLLARKRRRDKPASTSPDVSPVEFVYNRLWDFGTMRPLWIPHQVVKKTLKRVFVRQEPHRQGESPRTEDTYSLDRKKLETKGSVSGTTYYFFSTIPSASPATIGTNDAELLGIKMPCNKHEVVRAFRRCAKATHPDAGGTSEDFMKLRDAYNRILSTI